MHIAFNECSPLKTLASNLNDYFVTVGQTTFFFARSPGICSMICCKNTPRVKYWQIGYIRLSSTRNLRFGSKSGQNATAPKVWSPHQHRKKRCKSRKLSKIISVSTINLLGPGHTEKNIESI